VVIYPFGSGMANTEGFARTYDDSKPPTSSFARPRPPAKTNRPVGIIPDPNRMANRRVSTSPNPSRMANRSVGISPGPIAVLTDTHLPRLPKSQRLRKSAARLFLGRRLGRQVCARIPSVFGSGQRTSCRSRSLRNSSSGSILGSISSYMTLKKLEPSTPRMPANSASPETKVNMTMIRPSGVTGQRSP